MAGSSVFLILRQMFGAPGDVARADALGDDAYRSAGPRDSDLPSLPQLIGLASGQGDDDALVRPFDSLDVLS